MRSRRAYLLPLPNIRRLAKNRDPARPHPVWHDLTQFDTVSHNPWAGPGLRVERHTHESKGNFFLRSQSSKYSSLLFCKMPLPTRVPHLPPFLSPNQIYFDRPFHSFMKMHKKWTTTGTTPETQKDGHLGKWVGRHFSACAAVTQRGILNPPSVDSAPSKCTVKYSWSMSGPHGTAAKLTFPVRRATAGRGRQARVGAGGDELLRPRHRQ